MQRAYPTHWEADVVLSDGGAAHVRPIRPDDADRLRRFHSRLSPESVYLRFLAPHPRLSERDVEWFTNVDHDSRAALIATIGTEMVAVVRYEGARPGTSDSTAAPPPGAGAPGGGGPGEEAEVAFLVEDAEQGRGLGSVLLEHIAAAARERGVRRFVADVLPGNRRMVNVFLEAGYQVERSFDEGVLRLGFELEPTQISRDVVLAREHRAEARSIQRLLGPHSVAVIGASRDEQGVGHALLRHLLAGDFQGPVYPVHPESRSIAGVRAYPTVLDIPDEVDLAVVALSAGSVLGVVGECARKGVHGLVVVSAGFGETGAVGQARQRELVQLARAHGMRVVGPNCLGVANTDPAVRLNATLAPTTPGRGRVGFFSQSGALGIAILERVAQRGLGLSTFVSAGNRADVSGNDLLQFWEDDEGTEAVLLYLESLGNPRKFTRLARRLARDKPVITVKSGRRTQGVPLGHAAGEVSLPDHAVGELLGQVGIIRVDDLAQLFDVAQLVAYQPLPGGDRVGIVGNSDALGLLVKDACLSAGLRPWDPVDLGPESSAADFEDALGRLVDAADVDSVVTVFTPPLQAAHTHTEAARALALLAERSDKPIVTTFLGYQGLPEQLQRLDDAGAPARGSVPSYPAPEGAVRALAHATRYAEWRRTAGGSVPSFPDVDLGRARAHVAHALGDAAPVSLDQLEASRVLAAYGVTVWPVEAVTSADEAVAAAARLGYPVALRAAPAGAPGCPGAGESDAAATGAASETELRHLFASRAARGPGPPGSTAFAVQRMPPAGVSTVIGATEDPSFGAVVRFGIADEVAELLGDRAYRLAPLTDAEAAAMVRSVRASPLLFGHHARASLDTAALEELLCRVSQMVDDLPETAMVELAPVVVSTRGTAVLGAGLRLAPAPPRPDSGPRRLRWPV